MTGPSQSITSYNTLHVSTSKLNKVWTFLSLQRRSSKCTHWCFPGDTERIQKTETWSYLECPDIKLCLSKINKYLLFRFLLYVLRKTNMFIVEFSWIILKVDTLSRDFESHISGIFFTKLGFEIDLSDISGSITKLYLDLTLQLTACNICPKALPSYLLCDIRISFCFAGFPSSLFISFDFYIIVEYVFNKHPLSLLSVDYFLLAKPV